MQDRLNKVSLFFEPPFRFFGGNKLKNYNPDKVTAPIPGYEELLAKHTKQAVNPLSEYRYLYEMPLLKREQEFHLLRHYNYLKWLARKKFIFLKKKGNLKESLLKEIEDLIEEIKSMKQKIASHNVRLVVHFAKKFSAVREGSHVLQEMISDGNVGLMTAVDYFNFTLGHRFATYAAWVIKDTMNKASKTRMKYNSKVELDEYCEDVEYDGQEVKEFDLDFSLVREALTKISPRHAEVVSNYFLKSMRLHEIGNLLGITKERVRQLKEQGLYSLRKELSHIKRT